MGQLLTRAKRVLQGKLARLLEGGPGARRAGPAIDSGFEAERARTHGPKGGSAAAEPRARAFAILEVAPSATPSELRSSYRRLCRRYHPDRFDQDAEKSRAATELLAEVNAAYDLLTADRGAR